MEQTRNEQNARAIQKIERAILDGTLKPQQRVDVIMLQASLGLPLQSVLEALDKLAHVGYLDVEDPTNITVSTPPPEQVEESLQTLGIILGGALRVGLSHYNSRDKSALNRLIFQAQIYVQGKNRNLHIATVKQIYAFVLERCNNGVLQRVANNSIDPLIYHFTVTAKDREPNWKLLEAGWGALRKAINQRDPIAAQLAFEQIHRLPNCSEQWESARWTQPTAAA